MGLPAQGGARHGDPTGRGGYWTLEPRWLQPLATVLLHEPMHWIMQERQFENLKRRAEAAAIQTPAADSRTVLRPDGHSEGVGSVLGFNV